MKIGRTEAGDFGKTIETDYGQLTPFCHDQPLVAKPLQRTIDVNGRHPGRVRQLGLGQGESERLGLVDQIDDAEPDAKLANQVGKPLQGVALAHVEQPFAQSRFIDQRPPQHGPFYPGIAIHEVEHFPGGNLGHHGIGKQPYAVIHLLEEEDLDVAKVAGEKIGHDLTAALHEALIPVGPAFQEQEHRDRLVSLGDKVASAIEPPRPAGKMMERLSFFFIQRNKAAQLSDQRGHRDLRASLAAGLLIVSIASLTPQCEGDRPVQK